jgi:hypothetical protein
MNDFTQRTIEALTHMHGIKAGIQEFVSGGKRADEILATAIAHLEANDLPDGAYGGPANAALSVAGRAAIGWFC